METYYKTYKEGEVICRAGDPSSDLYFLNSGLLLVCTIQGTQVKAIAKIGPGEFFGELSFFDGKTRSSNIVVLEESTLLQIPKHEIVGLLPDWYLHMGRNLTKKIRSLDKVIHESNIRKASNDDQKPLTIDEQRKLYTAITQQDT